MLLYTEPSDLYFLKVAQQINGFPSTRSKNMLDLCYYTKDLDQDDHPKGKCNSDKRERI